MDKPAPTRSERLEVEIEQLKMRLQELEITNETLRQEIDRLQSMRKCE